MTKVNAVFCACGIFLLLEEAVLEQICGISNFGETLTKTESDFINISYIFNVTESLHLHQKLFSFEVCEMTSRTPITRCKLLWKNQSNTMTVSTSSPQTQTICSWKQRDISSSTTTFELQISQMTYRSLSLLKFSGGLETDDIIRMARVDVLYPPKVTHLTVNGQEANGDHFSINEGEEVNVSCGFDRGNPPASFQLLTKRELETERLEGVLHALDKGQCDDEWPTFRCEGNSSERNRSISVLVRCPPLFHNTSSKYYVAPASDVRLSVKTHTLTNISCFLTPFSMEEISSTDVHCSLNGTLPYAELIVDLSNANVTKAGNWTLTIQNDKGTANTTLTFVTLQSSVTQQSGNLLFICISAGCSALTSVIIFVVLLVVRIQKQKHDGFARPADRSKDSINVGEEITTGLYDGGGFGGDDNFDDDDDDDDNDDNVKAMTVNDVYERSEELASALDAVANKLNPPNKDKNHLRHPKSSLLASEPPSLPASLRLQDETFLSRTGFGGDDNFDDDDDDDDNDDDVKAMTVNDVCERSEELASALDAVANKLNPPNKDKNHLRHPKSSLLASEPPSLPASLRLQDENFLSRTGRAKYRQGDTYFPPTFIRKGKEEEKDSRVCTDEESDAAAATVTTGMPSSSGHRNADGLIYGDLDFTDRKVSDIIIGSASGTEYADINVTAIVPPPRDYPH